MVHGRNDRLSDGCSIFTDEWKAAEKSTFRHTDSYRQLDRHGELDRESHRQLEGHTDEWMDGQMDVCRRAEIDKQIRR